MRKSFIPAIILLAWCIVLIKVLVFKDLPLIRIGSLMLNFGGKHEGPANLVPFTTILPYLRGDKGWLIAGINLLGNIILPAPVGWLVPLINRGTCWKTMLTIALIVAFALETMQAIFHVGIFDIDDVILNALGVMTGYWAFLAWLKMTSPVRWATVIMLSVALFGAAFFLFGDAFTQQREFPVLSPRVHETGLQDTIGSNKGIIVQKNADPCGGTGGTGQITNTSPGAITLRLGNGENKLLQLTSQTTIRNAAGPLPATDLKTGDRVTVVIDTDASGNIIASLVLVCNLQGG